MQKLILAGIAYASTPTEIINKIKTEVLYPVFGFFLVLGTVMFLWGVIEFIANADNDEKRSVGKRHMIWGILGLAIMISVGGLIQILINFWH